MQQEVQGTPVIGKKGCMVMDSIEREGYYNVQMCFCIGSYVFPTSTKINILLFCRKLCNKVNIIIIGRFIVFYKFSYNTVILLFTTLSVL